ncbi:chain length determinant protein EpsF [Paludibacterium paludis]|uniref:Tyrosine-protein kinase G-rich domain-containing protein n=1 Tax=Paludibacterium paludis TaxID=1225769 RepID=A0A918P318_9NEIS|nr:chain length determinant protein EpsF [Paludibacterium paludis]GGY15673.1 hypothetical protein GCM10011289_18750 [Paludibacterium paludis]
MNFELFVQILKARRKIGIGVFGGVVVLTLLVSVLLPKQYTAETSLAIDVKATDPLTGQPLAAYMMNGYLQTQVDIMTSQATALNVVDSLGLTKLPEAQQQFAKQTGGKGDIRNWLAKTLLRSLEVKPARESSVITMSYTSGDPKFAATLAHSFAQSYIRTLVDMRANSAQQNNSFFQLQLKTLQGNLETAQKNLADFQQKEGIIATDERLDVETQRLNEISSQLVTAQSATIDAQSRAKGVDAPDVLSNPLIQQLKSQVASQEVKLRELGQKVGPNHPHYQQARVELDSIRDQLGQLQRQYAGGLNSIAGNSAGRQAALQAALKAQKEKVLELKTQRSRVDVLQREVENAQRAYDQALQRFSQTMLESRSDQANVAILEDAVEPTDPSKPRVALNFIVSLFVGGLLGVISALVAELLNRKVRTADDIETLLELPVLAVLRPPRSLKRNWSTLLRFGKRKLV